MSTYMSSKMDAYDVRRKRPVKGKSGKSATHDSALQHVTGEAIYIDDMPVLPGTLHLAMGLSEKAHAKIKSMDLSAVKSAPGVRSVVTVDDVPGQVDIGPVFPGDVLFADDLVQYVGQPLFAVGADTFEQAKMAAKLAKVEYEELPAVLTIQEALKQAHFVRPTHEQNKGDYKAALENAPNTLSGDLYVKGQEHFYLEGQVSYVWPQEDGGMQVYTSSQHPTEVQKLIAEVLDLPINHVQVQVRRMGGGFGGKETQAAPFACMASLMAHMTGRPVKARIARQDDMVTTGKRHDFYNEFTVGYDDQGKLLGADIMVAGMAGYSPDLTDAIVDRAMFHSDNAYNFPAARVVGHRAKTHTVSNTAFRGFGGPQGVAISEYILDNVARAVGRDPLDVRLENLYKDGDVTHYGQTIEDYHMHELITQLADDCEYRKRREAITAFNTANKYKKRGMALTPVKFGISFTVSHLNQAGALVNIYTDGSIHLNHGGTEMGQGLFTKVAQVVANEFQVDLDMVKVSATNTEKVPNTSPTAASSGTDLNGKAAQNACIKLKERLDDFGKRHYGATEVRFENNHVVLVGATQNHDGMEGDELWIGFGPYVEQAYMGRTSLSATGYYATPKIYYDRAKASGRPFFYYATGAACTEVEIDTLTGEYDMLRADILHDAGHSLNPAIDIGQIEGAYVQGMGWMTTEELNWDDKGRVISNGPATYKIPTAADMPNVFNTKLFNRKNAEETIYNSKAVGEPPLMHGISAWLALRDAAASVSDYKVNPPMNTPATPERVLDAVNYCKANS